MTQVFNSQYSHYAPLEQSHYTNTRKGGYQKNNINMETSHQFYSSYSNHINNNKMSIANQSKSIESSKPIILLTHIPRKAMIKILNFIPHSVLIRYSTINHYFHHFITNDFPLFLGYTLELDCGRRASFLNRNGTTNKTTKLSTIDDFNFDENDDKIHSKNKTNKSKKFAFSKKQFKNVKKKLLMKDKRGPKEIIISDSQKCILITGTNRPLKSDTVRNAIKVLSKTKIDHLHIKRLLFKPGNSNNNNNNNKDNISDNPITQNGSDRSSNSYSHGSITETDENNINNNNNNTMITPLPVLAEATDEEEETGIMSPNTISDMNGIMTNDTNNLKIHINGCTPHTNLLIASTTSPTMTNAYANVSPSPIPSRKNTDTPPSSSSNSKLTINDNIDHGSKRRDSITLDESSTNRYDSDTDSILENMTIASPLVRAANAAAKIKKLKKTETNNNNNNPQNNNPVGIDVKRLSLSTVASVANGSKAPHDEIFEEIISLLSIASFSHIKIGEECGSWTWQTLIYVLEHFPKLSHLQIHICGFDESLPLIEQQSDWEIFIASASIFIPSLKFLCCTDDSLLRHVLTLASNRHKFTTKSSILNKVNRKSSDKHDRNSNINSDDTDTKKRRRKNNEIVNNNNNNNPKKRHRNKRRALKFVRYQSQFSPLSTLTGIEFDGVRVLEIVPWDGMFLNVPESVYSLRISQNTSFRDLEDDWTVLVPQNNKLRELCLWDVNHYEKITGIQNCVKLEHLAFMKSPRKFESVKSIVYKISYYAPLKFVSCLWRINNNNYSNGKIMKLGKSQSARIPHSTHATLSSHSSHSTRGQYSLPPYIDVTHVKHQREIDNDEYAREAQSIQSPLMTNTNGSNTSTFSFNQWYDKNISPMSGLSIVSGDTNSNKSNGIHPKTVVVSNWYHKPKKLMHYDLSYSDFKTKSKVQGTMQVS